MDFPGGAVTPTHLHTWTRNSGVATFRHAQGATNQMEPSTCTWVANYAVYISMSVPYPYAVNRVFWVNGSAGGANVDFGIFTPGGRRIYSTGAVAQSGTSVVQYVTPSTTFALTPGRYVFGLSCSGTTNTVYGYNFGGAVEALRCSGILMETSAHPLPASATFATVSGIGVLPYCGVTRTTTGF